MKNNFLMMNLLAVLIILGIPVSADAVPYTYGFVNITNNNAIDSAIGEAQLSVDVTDPGNDQVLFTFLNAGLLASSICDVYFDDGSLLGIASIVNGSGVSFSRDASPSNLPGGNNATPPFVTTAGFSADSDTPVQSNGVNPGESLGILFNLQSGLAFANVVTDLGTGALRIGIHVQGFASGGSESYINGPPDTAPPVVPEPAAALLIGTGLCALGFIRRKFKR